jgi:hypothetical protein
VAAREALELNDGVQVFVEDRPELVGRVPDFFHGYRRHLNPQEPAGLGERLLGVTVQAKSLSVSFQVADWIAYEMHKEAKRQLERSSRAERWPLKQFRTGGDGKGSGKGLLKFFCSAEDILDYLPAAVGGRRP